MPPTDTISSSPDPLASSMKNLGHSSPSKPLSSPSKSSPVKLLHDFTITTPPRNRSRSRAGRGRQPSTSYISSQSLPLDAAVTGDNNSPWKIRVTVSAEPGSDASYERPVPMTKKVPLRGLDDEGEDFIRGRGSGREIATSPVRGKARGGRKRSATPARKGNARARKSLTDLDITVLGDDSDDAATKPRRRRSSRTGKKASKKEDGQAANKEAEKRSATFQIAEDDHYEHESDGISAVEVGNESEILQQRDPNTISIPRSTPSKRRTTTDRLGLSDRARATTSYPTPSLSPGRDGIDEAPTKDPTEEHAEFDSILESEGFTMISLESIPSAKQFVSSPLELPHIHHGSPEETAGEIAEEESDISSTVPDTSPPVPPRAPFNTLSSTISLPAQVTLRRRANRTPEPPRSSPRLPSPPAPRGAEGSQRRQPAAIDVEEKPTPPGLARVRKIGRELQGVVVSPEGKKNGTPIEKLNGLFARGSSTGGLRLGDELAVKRRGGDTSSPALRNSRPVTPARDPPRQPIPDTRERQWQLEREAVSRQIQMANTSQVIVIDSDDEDEIPPKQADHEDVDDAVDEDDEDIWLQEAHNSSQHSASDSATNSSPPLPAIVSTQQQHRRGTIPSPWKRGEDVDQSTYLSNGDMSGIFWQQPTASKSASSALRNLQREMPAKGLDMRKLLGVKDTPQRLERERINSGADDAADDSNRVVIEPIDEIEHKEEEVSRPNENADGLAEDEEEASNSAEMDTESLDSEEVRVQGEPSSTTDPDAGSFDTEDGAVNEESIPTSAHDAEGETSIESTAASSEEVSHIAPVKIPVNFGDESSLTRDHETSIASKSSEGHSEGEPQSECVTPEANANPTGSSWLGRLSIFRSPWGKAEGPTTTSTPVQSEEPFSSPWAKSQEQSTAPTSVQSDEASMNSTTAQIEAQLINSINRGVGEVSIVSSSTETDEPSVPSSPGAQDEDATTSFATAGNGEPEDAEGEYQPMSKIALSACQPKLDKEAAVPETPSPQSERTHDVKQIPLRATGPWSKDHYRALHRLYLKSLKRDAPKVRNIRPELMTFLNETAMSGTGRHEHRVTMTQKELAVVEDFMRSLEQNAPGQRLGWAPEDLTMRLYSIIAGYKARGRVPVV